MKVKNSVNISHTEKKMGKKIEDFEKELKNFLMYKINMNDAIGSQNFGLQ